MDKLVALVATGIAGIIPAAGAGKALLEVASGLVDLVGRKAREEHTKAALEILKMKCDIAVLSRKEGLDLPGKIVTEEDLAFLKVHSREAGFLDAERLRTTFTYRYTRKNRKYGSAFAALVPGLTALYAIMVLPGILLSLLVGPHSLRASIAWSVLYALAWSALLAWSIRIRRAKHLAVADAQRESLAEAPSRAAA